MHHYLRDRRAIAREIEKCPPDFKPFFSDWQYMGSHGPFRAYGYSWTLDAGNPRDVLIVYVGDEYALKVSSKRNDVPTRPREVLIVHGERSPLSVGAADDGAFPGNLMINARQPDDSHVVRLVDHQFDGTYDTKIVTDVRTQEQRVFLWRATQGWVPREQAEEP